MAIILYTATAALPRSSLDEAAPTSLRRRGSESSQRGEPRADPGRTARRPRAAREATARSLIENRCRRFPSPAAESATTPLRRRRHGQLYRATCCKLPPRHPDCVGDFASREARTGRSVRAFCHSPQLPARAVKSASSIKWLYAIRYDAVYQRASKSWRVAGLICAARKRTKSNEETENN